MHILQKEFYCGEDWVDCKDRGGDRGRGKGEHHNSLKLSSPSEKMQRVAFGIPFNIFIRNGRGVPGSGPEPQVGLI